jgi:hypothetical protein
VRTGYRGEYLDLGGKEWQEVGRLYKEALHMGGACSTDGRCQK